VHAIAGDHGRSAKGRVSVYHLSKVVKLYTLPFSSLPVTTTALIAEPLQPSFEDGRSVGAGGQNARCSARPNMPSQILRGI
jgi:hypothetical protein